MLGSAKSKANQRFRIAFDDSDHSLRILIFTWKYFPHVNTALAASQPTTLRGSPPRSRCRYPNNVRADRFIGILRFD
jgi:hypothetical protein